MNLILMKNKIFYSYNGTIEIKHEVISVISGILKGPIKIARNSSSYNQHLVESIYALLR